MNDHYIQIVYHCGEEKGDTYVTRIPINLDRGKPATLAIREATWEATRWFLESMGKDMSADPK